MNIFKELLHGLALMKNYHKLLFILILFISTNSWPTPVWDYEKEEINSVSSHLFFKENESIIEEESTQLKHQKLLNKFGQYLLKFKCCFLYYEQKIQKNYFKKLPTEIIYLLSEFLDSVSILKLSQVNIALNSVFNDSYWLKYYEKLPKKNSYLIQHGPLSPRLNKRNFFLHLWYRENKLLLAAQFGHPEAYIQINYKKYGLSISYDQYVDPQGLIRFIDSSIDKEKSEQLKKIKQECYLSLLKVHDIEYYYYNQGILN